MQGFLLALQGDPIRPCAFVLGGSVAELFDVEYSAVVRILPIGEDKVGKFIEVSWRIHRDDPRWIAPLRTVLAHELSSRSAFSRYGKMQLFLCEERGRIAAIVNPRLGPGIGQIGYFETENDPALACGLFEAACEWLCGQGVRQVVGPMNGGAHRPHRLMVRGFERAPFLFEPRNPPYYPRLFEANGFRPIHRWASFELSSTRVREIDERLGRLRTRSSFRTVALDPRTAMPRLHGLLDEVWRGHIGYASFDLAEMTEVFGGLMSIIDERHVGVVVDGEGRDVGCAFMYPDYVEHVRRLAGDASGWGSWLGARLPKRLVLHTVAVLSDVRGAGPALLLIDRGIRNFLEEGYEELIVALVVEEFGLFHRFDRPTREYALYGRNLTTPV